jgi:hypothetical protein
MTPTIERRFSRVEVRTGGEGKTLVGRAVEYNQPSELLYGAFREEIAPGTFDASLASGRDVYCSIDHDPNRLLGRLSANTLTLLPDARGIGVECPIAGYSYAADLIIAIQRKDLRGMSFIFDVIDDKWEKRAGVSHRTVLKADLYEVSFVFSPAYQETSAGIRTAFPVAGEQRAIERAKGVDWQEELDRYRRRLRLAECL